MAAVHRLGYPMNFAAELADAVIDAARREGYTVLVERTDATRAGELEVLSGGRLLLGLGRRRIDVIGVHAGEAMGSGPLRLGGHAAALATAGLAVDPDLLVDGGAFSTPSLTTVDPDRRRIAGDPPPRRAGRDRPTGPAGGS